MARSATATIDQGQWCPDTLVEGVRNLKPGSPSSGRAIDGGRTTIDNAISALQTLKQAQRIPSNKIGELTQRLAQLDADNARD